MATFQVPQFIEQKPKIVGFLTLPQFLYVAAATVLIFAFYFAFTFFIWMLLSVVIATFAISFAFVKVGGQPFPLIFRSAVGYIWAPRRYTWQRAMPQTSLDISSLEKLEAMRKRMTLEERIKSVALGITTGKMFSLNQFRTQTTKESPHYQVVTYITGERKLAKRIDY